MQWKESPQKCCATEKEFSQRYLGPALQLLFPLAQDVQQNRDVCVCLWELPEGRSGAKREPQLLRMHRLLSSSPPPLLVGVRPRPTPVGGRHWLTNHPSSPSADDYCVLSSRVLWFWASSVARWRCSSLIIVLKSQWFASNTIYFSYISSWILFFIYFFK